MTNPATNALTYNTFVSELANLSVVNTTTVDGVVQGVDAAFNTIIPDALNYAELRIQRDCDILPFLTSNAYTLTPGNNVLSISINDFVTVQTLGVVVGGVNTPLIPVAKEYLQTVYGDPSYRTVPQYFAMIGGDLATAGNTSNNIMLGPTPDMAYVTTVFGTIRMPSLYLQGTPDLAATGTTWISTWMPDLLLQAAMIFVSEYQRQFGAMSNDPQLPGGYEQNYQMLLKGALVEEARKRFAASGWSSMSPPLVATPTR